MSAHDVDHREQDDPHDVNEVPVIGNDHCRDCLLVGEPPSHVGAGKGEQEQNQTASYVQAVETGSDEKGREIDARGDGVAFTDESDVLRELSSDEHRAHNEGQGVPLAHAPRGDRSKTFGALNLAMLSGVNAHLTGNRGQHQDQGVDGGGPHCEVRGLALTKGLLTCLSLIHI